MAKNIHVTHRSDGKWAVKGEGDEKASSLHETHHEAIEVARQLARNNKAELFIHDRENKIRNRDSFGRDPYPPRDTKH